MSLSGQFYGGLSKIFISVNVTVGLRGAITKVSIKTVTVFYTFCCSIPPNRI